jgi:hypothetical protein
MWWSVDEPTEEVELQSRDILRPPFGVLRVPILSTSLSTLGSSIPILFLT